MEKLYLIFLSLLTFISTTLGIHSKPVVTQAPATSTGSVASQSETNQNAIQTTPVNTSIATTTPQTELFIDPERRYEVVVPSELRYEYDKSSKELLLFEKNNFENKFSFTLSYLTKEGYNEDSYKDLTDKEINRVLKKDGKEIKIYDPSATEACSEETMLPTSDGGFLNFYSVCGNDETRPLFDKVILATEEITH